MSKYDWLRRGVPVVKIERDGEFAHVNLGDLDGQSDAGIEDLLRHRFLNALRSIAELRDRGP